MSIADYSDLLVAVGEYTARDDIGHLFPRFVGFAEVRLNRGLRTSRQETEATLTCDSDGRVNLPADFLEFREVKDSTGCVLNGLAMGAATGLYGSYAGTAAGYVIHGNELWTKPQQAGAVLTTVYYAKVPALADAVSGTNWLLQECPMAYLYAVCAEVYGWAASSGRDADGSAKASTMADMMATELAAYRSTDSAKKHGNSRMIVRGTNP